MLRILFCLPILLFPFASNATCDACAKQGIDAASQAMSQATSATTETVKTNGTSIDALKSTVDTGAQTLSSTIQLLSQQELTALDGLATKITLKLDIMAKEQIAAADHVVSSMRDTELSINKANGVLATAEQYGELAQTLTGDINTARSSFLASGFAMKEAIKVEHAKSFIKWITQNGFYQSAKSEQLLLLSKDELFDTSAFTSKKLMTEVEVSNFQSLIQLMVNPSPEKPITMQDLASDADKAVAAISQRRKNAIDTVVHSILTDALADKAPIIPTDPSWLKSYMTIPANDDGKVSFEQFYDAETFGKATSADWFLDIKTRTEAGLLREQIYQQNTSNLLLAEILKAERNEAKLIALSTLTKLTN